ncbi:MAG: complex I NDUFA9 subunit family protein [Verrucomicrobiae bacterium]|nr:complex I NDUFA9 subunit family protein [Verrucomicrobiae bacterium]
MKVLLTGATGFVGGEVLRRLLASGHQVRVLSRVAAPKGLPPDVEIFHGNLLHAPSLSGCLEGIEAVVHLVGIITETGEQTYDRVHRQATVNLIAEAKRAKVNRWIHMSALGARAGARSRYHQSKWAAEEALRASPMQWTIVRPSIIYGPRDQFVNLFAKLMRAPWNFLTLWTIPLFGGGHAYLQPVPVEDVAAVFVGALEKPESVKKIYDLCGPERLRLREVIRQIAGVLGKRPTVVSIPGRRRIGAWANFLSLPIAWFGSLLACSKPLLLPVPWDLSRLGAWTLEAVLDRPPLNRDALLMLEEDNVGDPTEAQKDFGISPPPFREGIERYLRPGKPEVQRARTISPVPA